MWPQIVLLAFIGIETGVQLAWHGKPKTGKWSFWTYAANAIIILFLLWKGGFFDVFSGG